MGRRRRKATSRRADVRSGAGAQRLHLLPSRAMKLAFFVAAATLIGVQQGARGSDTGIPYPAAFREWTHVKSTIVGPQSPSFANNGGLHHFYANAKALEGYRTGPFPRGAVLTDDPPR